jgi:outer membrane scaffolding protein for murein synthesis (MipA/OmpV family)
MPIFPVLPSLTRVHSFTLAVQTAAFLVLCSPVQAQPVSQEPAYGFSGQIGLGVASVPTYEGSPNDRALVVPDLTLSYRSRAWGSFELGQRGLVWNAVEAGRFRLALVAQFDPGRKDKDTSAANPTPGDKRLAGMGNVQASTEAGVGIGYGPVMLVARQSLSERGAKGAQADLTVEFPWSLSGRVGLRFAFGATWAHRDYMQTYFGVTAAQARATAFSVYTPKSGLRKFDAGVAAEYALASSWKLQAHVGFTRHVEDAAASPIVGLRHGASAVLSVAYGF